MLVKADRKSPCLKGSMTGHIASFRFNRRSAFFKISNCGRAVCRYSRERELNVAHVATRRRLGQDRRPSVAGAIRRMVLRAAVLKIFIYVASIIPLVLFVRSIIFRRSTRVRAAASAFDRQMGYLAGAIVAIVAISVIVFLARSIWPA
jgi:hypothetical protein